MFADLSRYPLAEVIRRLSAEQKSGDLEVRDGTVAKTIYFDRGRIVFAGSNQDADRLGDMLLSIGRISREDFDRVSKLMRSGTTRRRFGDALILAGLMDRDELGRSLARQVRDIVRSLFALESGAASFAERRSTIPVEYMVGVSIHRLLYAGIRSMGSSRLVRVGVGDLNREVFRADVPPFRFATYKCDKEELAILERCRKPVAIRSLAAEQGQISAEALKTIYALHASGVIEDAKPDPKALRLVPHSETGTFLLSVADPSPPARPGAVRLEVHQELENSKALDAAALVRVSDPAAVEQALQDKLERLCMLHASVLTDEDLRRDLEIVLGRTAAALHRARQLGTARSAITQMGSQARPSPRTRPPAAETVTQPPKPTLVPSPSPAQMPPTTLPPAPPSPSPRPPLPQATPPPSPTTIPPRPSEPVVDKRAQQLLATAQLRMQVRNNAGAVEALRELVALAPGVADYRLRLARAMAGWVPTLRQAEREYLQAIRLEPDNAASHYEFAAFYERLKFRGRALAQLRTALQLAPDHAQARALLERLSPREAAVTPEA